MLKKLLKLFSGNGSSHPLLADKRILVVDDGDIERKVTQKILEKKGCVVYCANNGFAALELACQKIPDLIVMDCVMPGLNGPEVCKRLKEMESTKNIPVVFLTGSDTPANIVKCYDLGAEQFLAKPVSHSALIAQVETTLSEHELA